MGWIVPSINVTAEDELIWMAPPSLGVHFARAIVDRNLPLEDQFADMVSQLPELATGLAHAGVGTVAFACTSASFFEGPDSDQRVIDALADAAGVPGVATATAVADALRHLDVKRVAVATPYVRWVYEREAAFLEARGFVVNAIIGLDRTGGTDISGITDDEIRALVAEVDSPAAEAIFVSCTDLPAVHLVPELERRHAKPVVTSNQAAFWACREHLGLGATEGQGRLLAT